MNEPTNGTRPVRAVVLWGYGVLLAALVLGTATFVVVIVTIHRSDAETACRARIATYAADVQAELDSTAWDAMSARVVEGRQIDLIERARQIADLRRRLDEARDLRRRSPVLCAENSDFNPPS